MKRRTTVRLTRSQAHVLDHWEAVLDALFCQKCGLQQEALEILALCGWTVGDFLQLAITKAERSGR